MMILCLLDDRMLAKPWQSCDLAGLVEQFIPGEMQLVHRHQLG